MKSQAITLCMLAAMWTPAVLSAKDINVTPTTFAESWASASDGDVLLMESGNYEAALTLQSGKTITLKAAADATVVLQQGPSAAEDCADAGLILDGLTIHLRKGDHFMRFCAQSIRTLEFRNCIIEEVPRCFFNATCNTVIDNITFKDCIIRECGTKGYCFIWSKASIKKLTVEGCTLYNYFDGESFFYQSNRRSGINIEFTFCNNTVSRWGIGDGDTMPFVNVADMFGRDSKYVFSNNLFIKSSISANKPNVITVASGTVTAENNLVVGFGDYNTSGGATKSVTDLSADELKLADGEPGFTNADAGDFTLPAKSPLRKAGTDKQPVGDPRWAK